MSGPVYPMVARLWAAVFAFVGGIFLCAPGTLERFLNGLAGLLGLPGAVVLAVPSLWWVLALSLMSVLTVLAAASARRPDDATLYGLIVLSKLVSTAGFAALAMKHGGAWWLGAISDGFVAATLVLARARDAALAKPRGLV